MIKNSTTSSTDIAIIKSTDSSKLINKGIEQLGGITTFIEKGDNVFIKINLSVPYGFPVNINFEGLRDLVILCKSIGANKIYIGGFPDHRLKTQTVVDILGIRSYLENFGAEILFLDDQISYPLLDCEAADKTLKIPKIVVQSDKLIIYNQVSVAPIFNVSLSLLNLYSLASNLHHKVRKSIINRTDYLISDQYKQDLISSILDIYSIKKPDLIINDLLYLLEGAGPFVYRDSNLKFTGFGVLGRDAITVDIVTLKLLGINRSSSDILKEAQNRKLGTTDISNSAIAGENLNNITLDVKLCVKKLEDIKINNTMIKTGRLCSGCFKEAYHLLNFMKTHMVKDLKYIKNQHFLSGENPPEPESLENIVIFGDCAILSTQDREFRKIRKTIDRNYVETVKVKLQKDYTSKKASRVKVKTNKSIIEIPGCPPSLFESYNYLQKYYKKTQTPNLTFFKKIFSTYYEKELKLKK